MGTYKSLQECRASMEMFPNGNMLFLCRYYVPHEKPREKIPGLFK